jgi:(p)ppGpp synthase/HD superfamily hydrolase
VKEDPKHLEKLKSKPRRDWMNKEQFVETENKVRRYFQKDKLINSLNSKISLLDKQIKAIDEDLKSCNINIEPGIKAISYEERVQSSGDGSSYAEKEAMRLTEFKIKRVAEKRLEKEKLLEQIDQIELDYIYIKDAIEPIKGIFKELLKMKYEKRMSEIQIGKTMNWSQSEINKKKRKLLKLIAGWDQWNKIS